MKRIMTSLVAVAVGVGATLAYVATAEEEGRELSGRYEELVQEKSAFRETFVLPGVDFTQYDKIYLWGAQFEYRDVGPASRTRNTMLNTHKREFGISESDREKFEAAISESFAKEIEKGKRFTVTDEIGPDTIILRGALLDIISRVPPQLSGRSEVYLASVGEATLVMELIDAENGSVLALVAERRGIATINANSGAMVPTNSATVLGDVRRWARSAAAKLRGELDKAMKV